MNRFFVGLVALVLLLPVGCTTRMGDLTIASTRLTELDQIDLDEAPTRKRVKGEDIKFIFLFIPFGIPHLEDAIDDALERGQGDLMTDVTVRQFSWWFLVGQTGFRVEGDVIDTRGQRQSR